MKEFTVIGLIRYSFVRLTIRAEKVKTDEAYRATDLDSVRAARAGAGRMRGVLAGRGLKGPESGILKTMSLNLHFPLLVPSSLPGLLSDPSSPYNPPLSSYDFTLQEIGLQFPGSTVQANTDNTEVGLISLTRPYTLPIWSTPATGQWVSGPYPIYYTSVEVPGGPPGCTDGCGPQPTPSPVPEPGVTLFMVAVMVLYLIWTHFGKDYWQRRVERRLHRQVVKALRVRGGAI